VLGLFTLPKVYEMRKDEIDIDTCISTLHGILTHCCCCHWCDLLSSAAVLSLFTLPKVYEMRCPA
jgi:hypothetical protein